MENLSQPVETIDVPVTVPVPAYLHDHLVAGRVVLPAVEALQIMVRTLPASAGADPCRQESGVFNHLLTVDRGVSEILAIHEFSRLADGRCLSRLVTVRSGRQAKWTRRVEHASVFFLPAGGEEADLAEGPAAAGGDGAADEGPVFTLSSRRLYDELVPFGPAYQNVTGDVCLTVSGAWADVYGGDAPESTGPLGSPFPADAAFHVACAWGQRYRNTVAFPVGFRCRRILAPTRAGETYSCRIVPLPGEASALRFDLRIYGRDGKPAEVIGGLEMRVISGGRRRPPAWVRDPQET
jgi:hypothetical protein